MRLLSSILFITTLSTSSTAFADLLFKDAQARLLPPTQSQTAAYLEISNPTDKAIVLVAASSDSSPRVEFHNHVYENGMAAMQRVENLPLAAGETLTLKPGGHHIMLFNLQHDWTKLDYITLYLFDENRKKYTVKAKIGKVESNTASHHKHHHH
ncbi:copper chaperone PCu(A)C [Catenovulum sediminis]|uniref:Copper chaperone PCu(A)C n=1 Tax=Catenovulum sediminis TaxID=1740262 RepID=A0ABV1RDE3_9ALTE